MKNFIFAIAFLMSVDLRPQDCYILSKEPSFQNFSNLWLGTTFQGTIGNSNQRIEVRFLKIEQGANSSMKYQVSGKSKVNQNICDFRGTIEVDSVYELNTDNFECEGLDFPNGYVAGVYYIYEDSTQNHVGTFNGSFKSKFELSSGSINQFNGWYLSHGANEFIGKRKEYRASQPKYCAWGLKIPPTINGNLFKHYDNEFYLFNSTFLDIGWKNYVIANLNTFLTIPVDFETDKARFANDFNKSFANEDIDKAREVESKEWWK